MTIIAQTLSNEETTIRYNSDIIELPQILT